LDEHRPTTDTRSPRRNSSRATADPTNPVAPDTRMFTKLTREKAARHLGEALTERRSAPREPHFLQLRQNGGRVSPGVLMRGHRVRKSNIPDSPTLLVHR